jgi:hypothetical protein
MLRKITRLILKDAVLIFGLLVSFKLSLYYLVFSCYLVIILRSWAQKCLPIKKKLRLAIVTTSQMFYTLLFVIS